MPEIERPEPPQSICIGCGLCCDGTLHDDTELAPGDEQSATQQGFIIVRKGEKSAFLQPCAKFGRGCCTIYEHRPGVCRAYRCRLLKDVEEDRVAVETALGRIETVKSLLVKLRMHGAEIGTPSQRQALWQQLREAPPGAADEEQHRRRQMMLDLAALKFVLDDHFIRQRPGGKIVDAP